MGVLGLCSGGTIHTFLMKFIPEYTEGRFFLFFAKNIYVIVFIQFFKKNLSQAKT